MHNNRGYVAASGGVDCMHCRLLKLITSSPEAYPEFINKRVSTNARSFFILWSAGRHCPAVFGPVKCLLSCNMRLVHQSPTPIF